MDFEWDEQKANSNYLKHRVTFIEAKTVFNDPFSITVYDPEHSSKENRFIDIGMSSSGHLIVVSYTERNSKIRIINCRRATKKEREVYEEGIIN